MMSKSNKDTSFFAAFSTKYAKWMPDAFLFAILLTFLTIILAYAFTDSSTKTIFGGWLKGFGWLMEFGFQVAWMMILAMTLVHAPVVHRCVVALARQIKSPAVGYAAIFFVGGIACWINVYGGVVVAAVFARTVAENVEGMHFPMVAGVTYSTFIMWGNGLSSSVGLVINTPGNKFEQLMGGLVPTNLTLFTPMNLTVTISMLVVLTISFYLMAPGKGSKVSGIQDFLPEGAVLGTGSVGVKETSAGTDAEQKGGEFSLATYLEESPIGGRVFGIIATVYIFYEFANLGFAKALNLNNIGFVVFALGMLAYRSPMLYMRSFSKFAGGCAGVLVQFPMFGGIMGIMILSGLAAVITNWFVSFSTATTFPLYSFLSAGLVNIFIPSGGAQWACQAPICIPAAKALGADVPKIAMTIAYGDAWTNMIQPFWMLMYAPVLIGGTTLRVRDLMGYCFFTLVISGIIFGGCLMLF
ncbi:MAG: TIGR00366 family protein [Pseudomonadota bacterium]